MVICLLLVAAMSAQNAPSTNKGRHLDIPAISREANGAIVSIVMSDKDGHPIAQGSGFLISKDGRVVTNFHVIKSGSSAVVKLPDGAFFAVDGVLASDKDRDVAVIKAHGNNFHTLTLGDSDRLQLLPPAPPHRHAHRRSRRSRLRLPPHLRPRSVEDSRTPRQVENGTYGPDRFLHSRSGPAFALFPLVGSFSLRWPSAGAARIPTRAHSPTPLVSI